MGAVRGCFHWRPHLPFIRREALFFFCLGKALYNNTTNLDPQQLKTVGVGLTFQSFIGATFISFVGHTVFVSQQMNFYNKREKITSNTNSSFLLLGRLKIMIPTVFLQQK